MKIDINKLAKHFAGTSFQVVHVHRYMREPGMSYNACSSATPGFVFPLSGKAEFIFNETPYILAPGNVIHGGAHTQLSRRVLGNTKWEYLLIRYAITGPEPKEFCLAKEHFELVVGQSPRLSQLLVRLPHISSQPGGIAQFQTETLFRNILEEMFVCVRNRTNDDARRLFEQVSSYIHERYMEALSIPALAAASGVNRNRLAYVFRKHTGIGPGDYLLQYRLNQAKTLLLANRAPLHEVAQAAGFNDPFHFSKAFKKQFEISPSEFRAKFINNTC
jgi:AraC-like DNA-binding protein